MARYDHSSLGCDCGLYHKDECTCYSPGSIRKRDKKRIEELEKELVYLKGKVNG